MFVLSFNKLIGQQFHYSPAVMYDRDEYNLLVAGKSGNTFHAFQLHVQKKPVLWRFDSSLQPLSSAPADIPLYDPRQANFITFSNHYFLFCTLAANKQAPYQVYKIDASGKIENQTAVFQPLVGNNIKTAGFSVVKVNNKLFILSATALPFERKSIITVKITDSHFHLLHEVKLSIDFNAAQETIQQLLITNDSTAIILKTGETKKGVTKIAIYRFNLQTGLGNSVFYSSDTFLFAESLIYANDAGEQLSLVSTVLSFQRDSISRKWQSKIFLAHLNDSLAEILPSDIIDISDSPEGSYPGFFRPYKIQHLPGNNFVLFSTIASGSTKIKLTEGSYYDNDTKSIRMTWINSSLHIQQDTILLNTDWRTEINFSQGLLHSAYNQLRALYTVIIRGHQKGVIRYSFNAKDGITEQLLVMDPSIEHLFRGAIQTDDQSYIFPYRKNKKIGLGIVSFR